VAAAVALLRAGFDWPTGTIPALVAAILVEPDTPVALEVVQEMLSSRNPGTRQSGLWALTARCVARRSAPTLFVPLVAPVLNDPDPDVRESVMGVLRQAGAAAARFADAVADAAGRFPDTAGERAFTVEYRAVETLQRLGDPRWVEPVCRAAARGHRLWFMPAAIRFPSEVSAAIRGRLFAQPADAGVLAGAVGHCGANADALIPHLVAAMLYAGPRIAETLLMLGRDDDAAVPHWRSRAMEAGDLPAALAVRRLTGDTARGA
jgi:hypothetical protein